MDGSKLILTEEKKLAVLINDLSELINNKKDVIVRKYLDDCKGEINPNLIKEKHQILEAERDILNWVNKRVKEGLMD